ncbi:MAG: endonuclease/exonuclease/phosphatase family protein [Promethearchaeota archaeon]
MQKYGKISSICLIGIIFYLFIESFYNVLVNINAYIFMNFSEIITVIPTLIIAILLIIFEYFFFMSARIKKKYKPYILTYIIVGVRISTQFVLTPSVILVLNLIMLFTILIFFMGFVLLMEVSESYINYSHFLGSVIIGLGIQFIFLTINISSNLTSDVSKLIPILIFMVILLVINNYLFYPDRFEKLISDIDKKPIKSDKTNISLFHFIILGILFIFSIMWIFNPMALSAYDIINLSINNLIPDSLNQWPTYGFTYYILLILLTAIMSYIIIFKYLFTLNQKLVKKIVIFFIGITCILTVFALYIIENDLTLISSIYISLMTVISVFSILFYISYLFNFYTFDSPKKLLIGIIIFFLTNMFFIILHVEILWYEYLSLLTNLIIQIVVGVLVISIYELKTKKITLSPKEHSQNLNKTMGIMLICVLIIYGFFIGVLVQERKSTPVQNPNPKFMMWNIHTAIGADDSFQINRLIQDIKENDPDILGLNEVDLGALKTSFIDMPSYIAHELNMYYFFGFTFYKHYGDVILSKYPILEAKIISLPLAIPSERPRSLIRAEIQVNSSIWVIFVTHLSTNSEDRLVQVPFIVNEIEKEIPFKRIIWMGDFNLEPDSTEYLLINSTSSLNFTDTYRLLNSDPGFTGDFDDNYNPHKRIDYIMCSPDLNPKNSEVFCSISSDHCAIITQF